MPVYDNTSLHEMNELLAQMKELHAPDRCEGLGRSDHMKMLTSTPTVLAGDVRTMIFDSERQRTIDIYKNKWTKEAVERQILFHYYKEGMQGFEDILSISFNVDVIFEKQCYLDGNYLCKVAHTVYGDDGLKMPGKKAYKLVVTWPDGRTEDWQLSFFLDKEQNLYVTFYLKSLSLVIF
jgi:hypothetical protein